MSDPIKISYSSVSRFHECSEKYWLAKEYELAGPTPSSLIFGSNVEKGIEALLLGKDLDTALEIFDKAWAQIPYKLEYLVSDLDTDLILPEFAKQYRLPQSWEEQIETDKDLKAQVSWLCCLIRGKTLIRAFEKYLLPDLKLHYVGEQPCTQLPISIQNDEGDNLVGFIDFVLEHKDFPGVLIADLKTASRLYTKEQLDSSEQLRTYIAARGHEFDTNRAGYIVLLKKIKKIKACVRCGETPETNKFRFCKSCKGNLAIVGFDADVQFIVKDFQDHELQEQLDKYTDTLERIKAGEREMNKDSCFNFGRKCEFYEHCHAGVPMNQLQTVKKKEPNKVLTEALPNDTTK